MRHRKSLRDTSLLLPAWWQNALHLWQIALAVPEIIAHRTTRMMLAGPVLSARDRREFTRMGQEKVEAFGESASAMGLSMYTLQQELALAAVRRCRSAWMPLASLTARSSPAQIAEAQSALIRAVAVAAGDQRMANACSRLIQRGLAPVHRTATANVKRLRGAKRRR